MFERDIVASDIIEIVKSGEVIAEYPDDKPYPSNLILGWIEDKALHVVSAGDNQNSTCYIITVYSPDPALWDSSFKRKI